MQIRTNPLSIIIKKYDYKSLLYLNEVRIMTEKASTVLINLSIFYITINCKDFLVLFDYLKRGFVRFS